MSDTTPDPQPEDTTITTVTPGTSSDAADTTTTPALSPSAPADGSDPTTDDSGAQEAPQTPLDVPPDSGPNVVLADGSVFDPVDVDAYPDTVPVPTKIMAANPWFLLGNQIPEGDVEQTSEDSSAR